MASEHLHPTLSPSTSSSSFLSVPDVRIHNSTQDPDDTNPTISDIFHIDVSHDAAEAETLHSDAYYHANSTVALTAYRLLNMSLILGYGLTKAVLTYQNQSVVPTELEWIFGAVCVCGCVHESKDLQRTFLNSRVIG